LSVARLYENCASQLRLIQAVPASVDRAIEPEEDFPDAGTIGNLNVIHGQRVQVIGKIECQWIEKAGVDRWRCLLEEIIAQTPPAFFLTDGLDIPPFVRELCESSGTPLFTTSRPCSEVIEILRLYLARYFADTTSIHGVFMDVFGIGVLITGESGIGKSELALDLVSRGHGLVADDVVKLSRISPSIVEGRSPDMLRDYLEVRGLGLLNIRTIYGETAARRKMKLKLIVHLVNAPFDSDISRLPLEPQSQEILGVPIRKLLLHVAPGRNLAVLIEAAVRLRILQLRGIDSTGEFVIRHQQAMQATLDPNI
jgi:HPr kinase/phosphorylase